MAKVLRDPGPVSQFQLRVNFSGYCTNVRIQRKIRGLCALLSTSKYIKLFFCLNSLPSAYGENFVGGAEHNLPE